MADPNSDVFSTEVVNDAPQIDSDLEQMTADAGEEFGLNNEPEGTEDPDSILGEALMGQDEPAPEAKGGEKGEDAKASTDDPDASEEESPEQEDLAKYGKGANKRIQQLVSQKKEVETQLAQREQQWIQWAQQQQMQLQQHQQGREDKLNSVIEQLSAQAELQQKQIELLSGRRQQEEEQNLSEVDRFKLQTERAATEKAMSALSPEIQGLKDQLAQMQQQAQEREQQLHRDAKIRTLVQDVQTARSSHFFRDFDPKTVDPETGQIADDMIMSLVAARGISPDQAGQYLSKLVDQMVKVRKQGMIRQATTVAPKKRPASTALPSGGGHKVVESSNRPSWQALKAAGYESYLDWRWDGAPPLSVPK